ncbi:MAG TPA: SPFH/Band 7/PHB domain protein, partial [Archangium sp.]
PFIVGKALQVISADGEVMESMFELLETQKLLESGAPVTLLPHKSGSADILTPLLASQNK